MTGNRLGTIWGLVAGQAAIHGSGMSASDACAAAVAGVQVTGAWLSAGSAGEGGHHLMRATDEVSRRLAELQLTLREGPSLDAFASGGPPWRRIWRTERRGCAGRPPAYAYVNDLRLTDVADDIVARRLRLHPGPGPSPDSNA